MKQFLIICITTISFISCGNSGIIDSQTFTIRCKPSSNNVDVKTTEFIGYGRNPVRNFPITEYVSFMKGIDRTKNTKIEVNEKTNIIRVFSREKYEYEDTVMKPCKLVVQ